MLIDIRRMTLIKNKLTLFSPSSSLRHQNQLTWHCWMVNNVQDGWYSLIMNVWCTELWMEWGNKGGRVWGEEGSWAECYPWIAMQCRVPQQVVPNLETICRNMKLINICDKTPILHDVLRLQNLTFQWVTGTPHGPKTLLPAHCQLTPIHRAHIWWNNCSLTTAQVWVWLSYVIAIWIYFSLSLLSS